ncbi:MAG: GNAT family N-acetyltransferase [Bacteroidota bacterium]
MRDDCFVVETLTEVQINQLLVMYQNELWSKERRIEDVKAMLQNSNIVALIHKHNNEDIGFARFLTDGIYRAFIYDVIISKKYRGSGYGRIFLETLVKHKHLKNVERVELYCQNQNVSFYEKFDFKEVPVGTHLMRRIP